MKWPGRGRQFGDLPDSFGRQFFFLLAMATKMVAAWSAGLLQWWERSPSTNVSQVRFSSIISIIIFIIIIIV